MGAGPDTLTTVPYQVNVPEWPQHSIPTITQCCFSGLWRHCWLACRSGWFKSKESACSSYQGQIDLRPQNTVQFKKIRLHGQPAAGSLCFLWCISIDVVGCYLMQEEWGSARLGCCSSITVLYHISSHCHQVRSPARSRLHPCTMLLHKMTIHSSSIGRSSSNSSCQAQVRWALQIMSSWMQ